MPKLRKPASIEKGLEEVIQILSDDEIQNAIGKSSSYLRKCSDPSQQQQLDHNDSVKLDIACVKKGKAPHLCLSHEYMIARIVENLKEHKQNDIDAMLVKSTILHGKLFEVVKEAEDPKSEKGTEISDLEKKEIMEAI